ncbi:MAG: hypothetical protein RMJ36_00270 [Candidatus Calescibacterium sp.]|nr:hypothetical protein [Candidatus Calescibacterium sp.]MDW8132080.1 hypothetical protein [Candidatus Calescibacterium sp.]
MKLNNNLYSSKKSGENIVKGVGIGAAGGAIVGSILGGIQANKKVKALPIETVEVKIKEPVYETREIGKIPPNQYVPSWPWGSVNNNPTESVYEKFPIKDESGKVVYKEYTQTFQGHGKPVVNYTTQEVKEPIFKGYSQTIWEDIDEYCIKNEYTEKCYQEVKGYWIRFYPKIDYKIIDTYQKPHVKFETGISYLEHILVGGLAGAAIGGIVGGVVAAALTKLSESRQNKK